MNRKAEIFHSHLIRIRPLTRVLQFDYNWHQGRSMRDSGRPSETWFHLLRLTPDFVRGYLMPPLRGWNLTSDGQKVLPADCFSRRGTRVRPFAALDGC